MIKTILIGITGIVGGLLTIVILNFAIQKYNNPATPLPKVFPTPTPVLWIQPSQALASTLYEIKGQVERIQWDKLDTEVAATGSALFQGDELFTGANSQAGVKLGDQINITLDENVNLELSSLVGSRVTLRQRTGEITYRTNQELNIVAGRSLVKTNTGQLSITIADRQTTILVISGNATLGYNDNSDTTKVWQLVPQSSVLINDITGQVKVINPN